MFSNPKTLKKLFSSPYPFNNTNKSHYVNVKMKRKKDPCYDSIDSINKTQLLKSIVSLKNIIIKTPHQFIPISSISKLKLQLEIPTKVSTFLRKYPSFFDEFKDPDQNNLSCFRLTPEATHLDSEERSIYQNQRLDILDRLRRLILMSKEKALPLEIIRGMQWYLGLPDDFLQDPTGDSNHLFEFVNLGGGVKGLTASTDPAIISVMQKNSMRKNNVSSEIGFSLFPSKGLRLKTKIQDWMDSFQKLPYISPYEDSSHLRRDSDVFEKRVVGVLHELLCLLVDNAAERRKLLCLRKHLDLPQKFGEAFERHPYIFYLSLKSNTCTVILKEAYASEDSGIEEHPLRKVRCKYIELMNNSKVILMDRRLRGSESLLGLDGSDVDAEADT